MCQTIKAGSWNMLKSSLNRLRTPRDKTNEWRLEQALFKSQNMWKKNSGCWVDLILPHICYLKVVIASFPYQKQIKDQINEGQQDKQGSVFAKVRLSIISSFLSVCVPAAEFPSDYCAFSLLRTEWYFSLFNTAQLQSEKDNIGSSGPDLYCCMFVVSMDFKANKHIKK